MLNKRFSEFLLTEMSKRDWTQSDLARAAGLGRGTLSNVMNNVRQPGKDTCRAIARALRLPPETVFRAAGLLPEAKPLDAKREMIVFLAEQLPEEEYEDLLAYINLRIERSKERGRARKKEVAIEIE